MGRSAVGSARGATDEELRASRRDVLLGMFFSNLVMYFIILVHRGDAVQGRKDRHQQRAAQAAQALRRWPAARPGCCSPSASSASVFSRSR